MIDHKVWSREFAKVIACSKCSIHTCKNLLRDSEENIPQPGFVGKDYDTKRVLMVGQNPAITKSDSALDADRPYTAELRKLRDSPTTNNLRSLLTVARGFMPSWRVHQDYFPLRECGLTLDQLAYTNIVRCRTARFNLKTQKLEDTPPNRRVAAQCASLHFTHWVDLLKPRVIIFLGKYAHDYGASVAMEREIPCGFLNRERSRSPTLRNADRERVAALVRKIVG
jgi:uracil-DNA glycosylase